MLSTNEVLTIIIGLHIFFYTCIYIIDEKLWLKQSYYFILNIHSIYTYENMNTMINYIYLFTKIDSSTEKRKTGRN